MNRRRCCCCCCSFVVCVVVLAVAVCARSCRCAVHGRRPTRGLCWQTPPRRRHRRVTRVPRGHASSWDRRCSFLHWTPQRQAKAAAVSACGPLPSRNDAGPGRRRRGLGSLCSFSRSRRAPPIGPPTAPPVVARHFARLCSGGGRGGERDGEGSRGHETSGRRRTKRRRSERACIRGRATTPDPRPHLWARGGALRQNAATPRKGKKS